MEKSSGPVESLLHASSAHIPILLCKFLERYRRKKQTQYKGHDINRPSYNTGITD